MVKVEVLALALESKVVLVLPSTFLWVYFMIHFLLPVEATICTGTSGQLQLFKDIIICKWCSVARDPDCLGIYSKDVHGTEPATHGILALLCSVYSSFSAIDLCFNSLSGDSASLYVCGHIQKIEYHSIWINSLISFIKYCMPVWF